MINCKYTDEDSTWVALKRQVSRMEQLGGFPFGSEAKRELCMALALSDDLAEATAIVDGYMHTETTERAPTPPELRQRINSEHERNRPSPLEILEESWKTPAAAHCARCKDTGVVETSYPSSFSSIASWCSCEAGRRQPWPPASGEIHKRHSGRDFVEVLNESRATLKRRFPKGDPLDELQRGRMPK